MKLQATVSPESLSYTGNVKGERSLSPALGHRINKPKAIELQWSQGQLGKAGLSRLIDQVGAIPFQPPRHALSTVTEKLSQWSGGRIKVTAYTEQEVQDYYQKHPERHPDHPRQVAIEKGKTITNTLLEMAGYGLLAASAGGALYTLAKVTPRKAFKNQHGLTLFNEELFKAAHIKSKTDLNASGIYPVFKIAKTNVEQSLQKLKGQLKDKQTQESYWKANGQNPERLAELQTQAKQLQSSIKLVETELSRLTQMATGAFNQKLAAHGSRFRVDDKLEIVVFGKKNRQAELTHFFQTTHPKLWASAQRGETDAKKQIIELSLTAGASAQNIDKKIKLARQLLQRAEHAGQPNAQNLSAIRNALQTLQAQQTSFKLGRNYHHAVD